MQQLPTLNVSFSIEDQIYWAYHILTTYGGKQLFLLYLSSYYYHHYFNYLPDLIGLKR